MIQHPLLDGNNGEGESFPQQNDSNSSRNPEVNTNPPKSSPTRTTNTPIFHKTKICYNFLQGKCHNGNTCNYAHGSKDLRQPPPNWQELAKENEMIHGTVTRTTNTPIFQKTQTCMKFLEGKCRNGDTCKYAHDSEDLRQRPPNWQERDRIQKMGICWKFYSRGECRFGEICKYLHERPAKIKAETAMEMERTKESAVIEIPTVVSQQQRGFEKLSIPAVSQQQRKFEKSAIPTIVSQQRQGFAKLAYKKIKGIYGDWLSEEEDEDEQVV